MVSLSLDAASAHRRANTCVLGTLAKLAWLSKCWRNPLPGTTYIIARVHIIYYSSLCWHYIPAAIGSLAYASLPLSQVPKYCRCPRGLRPRRVLLEDGVKR